MQLQAAVDELALAGLNAQSAKLDNAVQQRRLTAEVLLPVAEVDVAQIERRRSAGSLGCFGCGDAVAAEHAEVAALEAIGGAIP
ncbi:hypothetical protein D3C76_1424260 [compost metagenome]